MTNSTHNDAMREAFNYEVTHDLGAHPDDPKALRWFERGYKAALESQPRISEWQPIETCQKEERIPVHLYQQRKHWNEEFIAFWVTDDAYEDGGHWYISDGKYEHPLRGDCITHWMPLPQPPSVKE